MGLGDAEKIIREFGSVAAPSRRLSLAHENGSKSLGKSSGVCAQPFIVRRRSTVQGLLLRLPLPYLLVFEEDRVNIKCDIIGCRYFATWRKLKVL